MDEIEQFIHLNNRKFLSKKKHLFAPLALLNLKTFGCVRLNSDGRFAHLSNDLEAVQKWYHYKQHLLFPYLKDPRLLRTGYAFAESTDQKHKDFFIRTHKVDRGLVIIQVEESQMNGFIFFPQEGQFEAESLFSNLEMILKFSRYFLQEADCEMERIMAQQFDLKKDKGESFSRDDAHHPLSRSNQKVNHFLKAISLLTPREQQCLDLLKQGRSAQSTAAILEISRRTVEHHIDNIKMKFKCNSKWELLNK